jgi:hypothetical protein
MDAEKKGAPSALPYLRLVGRLEGLVAADPGPGHPRLPINARLLQTRGGVNRVNTFAWVSSFRKLRACSSPSDGTTVSDKAIPGPGPVSSATWKACFAMWSFQPSRQTAPAVFDAWAAPRHPHLHAQCHPVLAPVLPSTVHD